MRESEKVRAMEGNRAVGKEGINETVSFVCMLALKYLRFRPEVT